MSRSIVVGGIVPGLLALALGALTVALIAVPSWTETEAAGRLAIVSLLFFAVALILGSARLVAICTAPMLAAAVIASVGADETAWVRSMVVGALWYVSVELAWEAIERRRESGRTVAFSIRRVREVSTVVTISLAVCTFGYAASSWAPDRGLLAQVPIMVALVAALALATRHITQSSPAPTDMD